jgi:23S rRNA (uracil1939-C5)-methyltransferase
MPTFELMLTEMANGGVAMGRDDQERVIFVPLTIPGERVTVETVTDKKRFARARLLEILEPSPQRVEPACPHFTLCGGCHFQHIRYADQLRYKENVIRDQLSRIGGIESPPVAAVLPNPDPWHYACDISFSTTRAGKLGFWSPELSQVIPIETCSIIHQRLLESFQDIDLELANLHRLTLRLDQDGSALAVLEMEDGEPPALETDFPISVALLLPDGTAANLVGDNYVVRSIKGRDFRVSAGSFFYPSVPALELMIDVILGYAGLSGSESLLELYSGVGTLTAFLAPACADIACFELNPDSVNDSAVNLHDTENISLYEGPVEEILPLISFSPDILLVDPPESGLPVAIIDEIAIKSPDKIIYVSSDIATLARDGKRLGEKAYRLITMQPIDMYPQSFQTLTVSLWHSADIS